MQNDFRQREFRDYYDRSDYFESFPEHYGARDSAFNLYARRYIFSIYYPEKHEKIVDLGCGWGNISLTLQRQGFDVVGIDYSTKSVGLCHRQAVELGLEPERFVCADVGALPLTSDAFDVIYTAGVVEHLFPDVFEAFLEESRRILRDGGKLIIGTPNPGHLFELLKRRNIILKEDVSHVDYKTMRGIVNALRDHGFQVRKSYYCPSHVPLFSAFEKLTLKFIPIFRRRICILARKA